MKKVSSKSPIKSGQKLRETKSVVLRTRVEPSLEKRLWNYLEGKDSDPAKILRGALVELLDRQAA